MSNLVGESIWVSQYKVVEFGIVVYVDGEPDDADGDVNVLLQSVDELDQVTTILTVVADNPETGTYTVTLSSGQTAQPGFYKITWTYEVAGEEQTYTHILEVVSTNPILDSMDASLYPVLDSVWMRFADLFDSPFGGPHLQVYYQTRFNRARVADLMGTSLRKLNVAAQPVTTYSLNTEGGHLFPTSQWGGILEQGAYIEVIKHLMRSYVEQPATPGVNVALLDRRDYLNRWQTILQMEQKDYDEMMDTFKIRHMGLGAPRVLVSGGVYGNYGPTRLPINAARPRYAWRFH